MWCFVRNCLRFRILGALGLVLCLLLTGCRAERARRTLSDAALSPVATPPSVLQPVPTYTPTPAPVAAEREALVALYQATQGPDWAVDRRLHWRREVPPARWTGVIFNAQGQVTSLALAGVGLRGQLPAALGQLTALEALDLAGNRLYGPLPRELEQLSLLQKLNLGGNAWTGCLPAVWRDLRPRQTDIGELGLPYCDTEVRGRYDDPLTHREGSYQLQRRETQITATLRTPRAPLPGVGESGPGLFTLPSGFWPGTPYTRLVWGHGVRADGRPFGSPLEPRRGRLQVAADGTVRLVAEGAPEPGYWAYTVTATWEVAPAGDPPPRPADPEETTPLHAAAAAGQAEVVRQLLTAGAALEAGDNRDRRPLHHAAQAGHVEVVELLLAAGADVQARDIRGFFPINGAIEGRNVEVVELLMAAGAHPSLGWAAQRGSPAIVQLILAAGADPNSQPSHELTPLNLAVVFQQEGNVELLLAAGADPEHALLFTWSYPSSLVTASPTITEQLLVAGANPNVFAQNLPFDTDTHPLTAAQLGDAVVVDMLLAAGVNPNTRDRGGTPLHWLCLTRGEPSGPGAGPQGLVVLERLLAAGANPRAVTAEGRTPLHYAVQFGWYSSKTAGWPAGVERLLAAGADPHQPDAEGVTPLQLAEQQGQGALAALLQAPVSPRALEMDYGWTALHQAAQRADRAGVAQLLTQGHDPNLRTYYGETALHQAVQGQDVALVELLVQAGADLEAQTSYGYTALHLAARTGSVPVVSALLAAGADRGHRTDDDDGLTPYQIAAHRGQRARPEVADLLRIVEDEPPAKPD